MNLEWALIELEFQTFKLNPSELEMTVFSNGYDDLPIIMVRTYQPQAATQKCYLIDTSKKLYQEIVDYKLIGDDLKYKNNLYFFDRRYGVGHPYE